MYLRSQVISTSSSLMLSSIVQIPWAEQFANSDRRLFVLNWYPDAHEYSTFWFRVVCPTVREVFSISRGKPQSIAEVKIAGITFETRNNASIIHYLTQRRGRDQIQAINIFKNLVTLACVVWSWWIQIAPFRIWHAFHLCYFDTGIRVVKNVSFHTRVIYDVVQRSQIVCRNYCILKWGRLATIHFCLCKNIYYAYIYILFWKFRLFILDKLTIKK